MIDQNRAQALAEGEEPREHYYPAGTFGEVIDQCYAWYENQFPELKGEAKIGFDNVGPIATVSAFMALDLKILAKRDPELLQSLANENSPVWADIHRAVEARAGNFVEYIKAYLRWSFVRIEQKIWEAGDRPPVGRYTPGARRGGSRSFSGGSSSGPRRSGPPGRDRGDRGPRRDGPSGGADRGPRPTRDAGREGPRERPDRGDKSRSRPPRNGEARNAGGSGGSHADQEQLAIETVKVAIDKLKAETGLAEVRLDPANSFFRRLQHKKAVSDGFYSYSTGEGNGRSVVVTRDRPANEDSE